MEITANVAHATVGGDLNSSCITTSSRASSYLSLETSVEPNEHTPLLAASGTASTDSARASSTTAVGTAIYTKECFNWRIIGLLLMFINGLVLATYLLWRQTSAPPANGYKLRLIRHDIWSEAHLHGQALLVAGKVVNVFITHTASEECSENCANLLQSLQHNHLGELPYNFLMAGDCETYEARGWQYASSFESLPQASSLVFAFVGDFSQWLPSLCQLQMAKALLWESQRRLKLQPLYQLYGLRNVSRSERDADALVGQLQLWPLYAGQRLVK
ncbi:peptidoglycan-recognition protein LD [Drosophila montana]|uniref:peptidoglycan-recognition protein LD n=1 Tax=Drosophila montana TaxID=40370 RepID=UPI00313F0C0D